MGVRNDRSGFAGIVLLISILVATLAIPFMINLVNTVEEEATLQNVRHFKEQCHLAERTLALRFAQLGTVIDDSSSGDSGGDSGDSGGDSSHSDFIIKKVSDSAPISGVKSGYVMIPPKTSEGKIPSFLEKVISKDPWGGKVKYYSWDLTTQTPPKEGAVAMFVSGGKDGVVETNSDDAECKKDDICYYIDNDLLYNYYSDDKLKLASTSSSGGSSGSDTGSNSNNNGSDDSNGSKYLETNPPSVIFGKVNVGDSLELKTDDPSKPFLKISNYTPHHISIGQINISLTQGHSSDISIFSDSCSNTVLSPGFSCTLRVKFSPKHIEEYNGYLNIPYDDGVNGEQEKQLIVYGEGVGTYFCGGSGTKTDPYKICNYQELSNLNEWLEKQECFNNTSKPCNYYFELADNIDATPSQSKSFVPLGKNHPIVWHLNGNGHTIYGLHIDGSDPDVDDSNCGLISTTKLDSDIENIIFNNVSITNCKNAGAVAGTAAGNIRNIKVFNSSITNSIGNMGGVVGEVYSYYKKTTIIENILVSGLTISVPDVEDDFKQYYSDNTEYYKLPKGRTVGGVAGQFHGTPYGDVKFQHIKVENSDIGGGTIATGGVVGLSYVGSGSRIGECEVINTHLYTSYFGKYNDIKHIYSAGLGGISGIIHPYSYSRYIFEDNCFVGGSIDVIGDYPRGSTLATGGLIGFLFGTGIIYGEKIASNLYTLTDKSYFMGRLNTNHSAGIIGYFFDGSIGTNGYCERRDAEEVDNSIFYIVSGNESAEGVGSFRSIYWDNRVGRDKWANSKSCVMHDEGWLGKKVTNEDDMYKEETYSYWGGESYGFDFQNIWYSPQPGQPPLLRNVPQ